MRRLVPLAVAVLAAVPFLSTLSGSFLNWDDNVNFLENPAYRGLDLEQVRWAFTSVAFGHYIPLTRLTWSVNWVLGGMNPWGYHLVNVLLHAANAVLFYVVARRLLAAAVADGAQAGRRGARPVRGRGGRRAGLWRSSAAGRAGRLDHRPPRPALRLLRAAHDVGLPPRDRERRAGPPRPHRDRLRHARGRAALQGSRAAVRRGAASSSTSILSAESGGWACGALVREKLPLLLVTVVGAGAVIYAVRQGAVLTLISEHGGGARISDRGPYLSRGPAAGDLAGRPVAALRDAGADQPARAQVRPGPGRRDRGHRGADRVAQALARRPRRVDVLGAHARPDERGGAAGRRSVARPLHLPVRHGIRRPRGRCGPRPDPARSARNA